MPSFVPDEPPEHAVSIIRKKALIRIDILRVIYISKEIEIRLDYISTQLYVNH